MKIEAVDVYRLNIARPNIHFLDLDSALDFKEDPVSGGMNYDETKKGGVICLSDAPGIGAEISESFLVNGSAVCSI